MSPPCRFQMNIHIVEMNCTHEINLFSRLHISLQQKQCNMLLTRSVVCSWLARLRNMTQQKSHCDDFQDSCHRIGLWKKNIYFGCFGCQKLWHRRYYMIWLIPYDSYDMIWIMTVSLELWFRQCCWCRWNQLCSWREYILVWYFLNFSYAVFSNRTWCRS